MISFGVSQESTVNPKTITIGRPAHLEAPTELVNHFNSMLNGIKKTLTEGVTSLSVKKDKQPDLEGSMLEEAALTVAKAEISINALETEIKKGLHHIPNGENMMNNSVQEISYQKIVSDFSNASIMVMGNKANDINEEMASLTKGRA